MHNINVSIHGMLLDAQTVQNFNNCQDPQVRPVRVSGPVYSMHLGADEQRDADGQSHVNLPLN